MGPSLWIRRRVRRLCSDETPPHQAWFSYANRQRYARQNVSFPNEALYRSPTFRALSLSQLVFSHHAEHVSN